MPAVVVVSEQFEQLARTVIKSDSVPDWIAIVVAGNPEYSTDEELTRLADRIMDEAVAKFSHASCRIPVTQAGGNHDDE